MEKNKRNSDDLILWCGFCSVNNIRDINASFMDTEQQNKAPNSLQTTKFQVLRIIWIIILPILI